MNDNNIMFTEFGEREKKRHKFGGNGLVGVGWIGLGWVEVANLG